VQREKFNDNGFAMQDFNALPGLRIKLQIGIDGFV
jgi:hypothetical protein